MNTTTTARAAWAELNEAGPASTDELRQALAAADADNWADADDDIASYNVDAAVNGEQPLTRARWYLGVLDAIEARDALDARLAA